MCQGTLSCWKLPKALHFFHQVLPIVHPGTYLPQVSNIYIFKGRLLLKRFQVNKDDFTITILAVLFGIFSVMLIHMVCCNSVPLHYITTSLHHHYTIFPWWILSYTICSTYIKFPRPTVKSLALSSVFESIKLSLAHSNA